MKKHRYLTAALAAAFAANAAAVDFTKQELDLVKDACLAGSSFDFRTEADGSISVKNLEGKGKLVISKRDVATVDLPDADKKEEFREIRNCIKDYLLTNKKPAEKHVGTVSFSRTCKYLYGPRAGQVEYFPPEIPIIPARIGEPCHDARGSSGFAIADN